jgi:high-affinity nickel-transport protein
MLNALQIGWSGMNEALPHDWLALVVIAVVLGLKHGLDPDHLATIDGLTRYNAIHRPRLARWSGLLFSIGHGLVVTLVAVAVAAMATEWTPPEWLEHTGAWISILFLVALGLVNLAAVFRAPPHAIVRPEGLKGRWLGPLTQSSRPVIIVAIGAAFALSFETWSQAALFSMTATQVAGWTFSLAMGLLFTAGMMVADGLNGLWVARLLRNADRRARIASRFMSLTIALLSLAIAALSMVRQFAPTLAAPFEGSSVAVSAGMIALLFASFLVAMRLSQPASN